MKYFLVFMGENTGSSEECNLFYSHLTKANSAEEAIEKVAKHEDLNADELDAEEFELIE